MYKRGYSLDIKSFQLCFALNPDSSIRMMRRDSPSLFAVRAFCFADDTFLCQQNLITNFVIIIKLLTIFACRIKIGLMLPVIYNFVPVGYEWNVKEHIAPKYCRTWGGIKDCVIGRANSHARMSRKTSTSSGVIVSEISSSDVHNICART
jgi:hypothetical protein